MEEDAINHNPEEKLAHQRLSVLELAQALGNVSEACRRRGISRTTRRSKGTTSIEPSARTAVPGHVVIGRPRTLAGSTCLRWSTAISATPFGFLHTSKQPEAVVAVLHKEAVSFYKANELEISSVCTDSGKIVAGHRSTRMNSTFH